MGQDNRVCFWCGEAAPVSRDHVFPRCLFPEPMPSDVIPITVPACERHNGAFSRHEEYFRDFILSGSYGHPQAKDLWDRKTTRALQRSPKYRAMLSRDVYDVEYQTRSGIHLGNVSVLVAKADRIELVFRKIIAGLYLNDYAATLGFPPMGVHQLLGRDALDPLRPAMETIPIRRIGHISFRFSRAADAHRAVLGIFFFFDRAAFAVYTDPREPDVADPLTVPATSRPPSAKVWTPGSL